MDDLGQRPFVVDKVIAVCNGCRSERTYPIDPPFRSAEGFIRWETRKPVTPCSCGYPTADLKLHLVDQQ